jgi:hypothetical protein
MLTGVDHGPNSCALAVVAAIRIAIAIAISSDFVE